MVGFLFFSSLLPSEKEKFEALVDFQLCIWWCARVLQDNMFLNNHGSSPKLYVAFSDTFTLVMTKTCL